MWQRQYIGIPWQPGLNKQSGLNCWELGQKIYRERRGIEIPDIQADGANIFHALHEFRSNPEYANWQEIAAPVELSAVLMGKGSHVTHIGWFTVGGILHSLEGVGSIFTPMDEITSLGYRVFGYWKHNHA